MALPHIWRSEDERKDPRPTPRPGLTPIPLSCTAMTVWTSQDANQTPGVVDRSGSLVRIALMLYGAGLSPDDYLRISSERDVALGWRKYSEREDASDQYRRIVMVV